MILCENPRIEVFNEDCMQTMARYEPKHFDLAIVDPEYGINASTKKSYHANALTNYKSKKWDSKIPDSAYFQSLFSASKNQVIWGGNYFTDYLPPSPKWIVWDKMQPEGIDQAMFELAWQSQQSIQAKKYTQSASSNRNCVANNRRLAKVNTRFHPTQKPVALYKWLLQNYAKEGDTILDTHGGSGSILIACWEMGFDIVWTELDKDYYEAAIKRFKDHVTANTKLFTPQQQYGTQLTID